MSKLTFRDAVPEDAGDLLEIYRYYVEHTAITFEWTLPSEEEFRQRMRRTMERYPYIVAELDGRIAGYAYAGPFVGRRAYDWSVEMTIYLDHEVRRRGIGGALYTLMEKLLDEMHILNLYACIGYPEVEDEYLTKNSAQFHEHMKYHLAGRFCRCGYKFARWYDMIWMEKILRACPDEPKPVANYNDIDSRLKQYLMENAAVI